MTPIVVGCGRAKRKEMTRAADLYTGGYVVGAVKWARSVLPPGEEPFILSALHGLIPGSRMIHPYSASFARRGFASEDHTKMLPAITPEETAEQVASLGWSGRVILLAGKDYFAHLSAAAPSLSLVNPFAEEAFRRWSDRRIGYQRHLMIESHGKFPEGWME